MKLISPQEAARMQEYRLAVIGFGNVGQGLAQILADRDERIRKEFGFGVRIVAVADLKLGSLYQPQGLDPAALLAAIRENGNLSGVPAKETGWDSLRTIRDTESDVVVELSPTDLNTGEPAVGHIRAALESGKHAITTNKGPIALQYRALKEIADAHGVQIGVEGTVMSGTPALGMGTEFLAAAGIRRLRGILNGTTNYILTRMQEGRSYAEALGEAQAKGYAEADPAGDVEGFDAAGKLVILANVLLGTSIAMKDVDREGITRITKADICEADEAGDSWKLIAELERVESGVIARVRPQRVPRSHPLASVRGATNAITFTTDLLGDVTLIGPGAGRLETGYAILCDLLAINRRKV
jgi:homoserine dehydrogenase